MTRAFSCVLPWRSRRSASARAAFTLAELLISMGASVLIIGALLLSSMSLQRSLRNSEISATAYSDQRRLTDYLARDIRRAVGMAMTDANGARSSISTAATTIPISERATLILQLPGYYRSQTAQADGYDAALEVVGTEERLDYGTADGLASTVEVSFRRIFYGKESCFCFIRQEAGTDDVIVRDAANLSAQVVMEAGAQTVGIKTWLRNAQNPAAKLVSTYDRMLLRNPPLAYRP